MNSLKLLSTMTIAIALLFLSMPARAQGIPYTATYQGTVLGELQDNTHPALIGVGNNPNGFHPGVATGTIEFAFVGDWNLSRFKIWNNINTTIGGVREFRLTFIDGNGNVLGTLQRTIGNTNPNEEIFNLTALVGVRRVVMEVMSSHDRLIEIREIWFEGTPTPVPPRISTCCPPSDSFRPDPLFTRVPGNAANSYHMSFAMNATFDAQMAAYVNLLKTLDPSVASMALVARAYNGGTGATAAINGGVLQTGVVFWVPPPNAATNLWPLPAFFTPVADLPTNTWTVIEISVWVFRPGMPVAQLCQTRIVSYRPPLPTSPRGSGSAPSGFVDYQGPPPRVGPVAPTAPPPR